jgi:hypothetical protein
LRRALEVQNPKDLGLRLATRETIEQQATILEQQGHLDQALPLFRANTPVFEQAVAAHPHNLRYQRLLADNRRHAATR